MEHTTDQELIARFRTGDYPEAFSVILSRHIKPVYNFIYRLTLETESAEDLTQETFVKVWKKIDHYNPKEASFKTWLFRIARNTTIDFLRQKKHIAFSAFEDADGANILTDTLADPTPDIEETLSRTMDAQQIEKLLERISPMDREILLMHYHHNLTFEEIGAVLTTSPNTVKSRHRRALLNLKKKYSAPR
ncbi:MAG: hypothetical protein RLZZ347_619 [Candidatus Parcubacteria bacterium]|jgi:RNA polymerase sigma-70 factor (ECF subfamily)